MHTLPLRALIALLLLPVLQGAVPAQSIYIFPPDSSGFPLLRSRIVALGADGRPLRSLTPSDILIQENGIPRPVTDLSCPPGASSDLSTVLAIDVSRSMGKEQQNGRNIDLAKAAASAWVGEMAPGRDECAVVTFDERNYLNLDFSGSPGDLMRAIDAIAPAGGTSYDAGFVDPPAGSILAAARGRHRRIVIFLTDGLGGGNEEKIVAAALRNNVTIYCVTLRMPAPPILRNISRRTGGVWFADVSSREEIVAIYRTIMRIASDPLPCEVTWRSAPDCRADRDVTAFVPAAGAIGHTSYTAPPGSIPTLSVTPSAVAFGSSAAGVPRDTTILLTAGASPLSITAITGAADGFAIVAPPLPLELAPWESRPLTLRYTPADASLRSATIGFTADLPLCSSAALLCSGGIRGGRTAPPLLKLLAPNGGETLLAGSDTTIAWSGLGTGDTVSLEYSTDGGGSWERVSPAATGGAFRWHVPRTPSGHCLARVSQMPRNGGLLRLHAGVGEVSGVAFSPDGSRVVVTGARTDGEMWDAVLGTMVKRMFPHGTPIRSMAWNPDGTMIATAGNDMSAKIWDAGSGKLLRTLSGHTAPVLSLCFTRDGRWLATGGADRTVRIWEYATGVCLAILPALDDIVRAVTCSPDGGTVAAAGPDRVAKVWSIRDRVVTSSIFLPSGAIAGFNAVGSDPVGFTAIEFSPDGSLILTGANDSTARLWDARTGALLRTLRGHRAGVLAACFSPDGRSLLTGSADGTAALWDVAGGALLRSFTCGAPVRAVGFNPAGRRVVVGCADGDVRIWELDMSALQQDRSDALWSIVLPRASARDVDMGPVTIGSPRDSVVPAFLTNTGSVPVGVREIRLLGKDAADFSIVSGLPPFDLPVGASADLELRFAPTAVGLEVVTAQIITVGDTIWKSIRGEGIARAAELGAPIIDFGPVFLGMARDTVVDAVLRNAGKSPLAVTSIAKQGPDTAQFTILGDARPFMLAPGESRAMRLRFAPVRAGGTSGGVAFTCGGAAGELVVVASLFGEGIDHPEPAIGVDRAVRFSTLRCDGSRATHRLILRNSGRAPLLLSGATLGGADAADFALSIPFAPSALAPGDSLAIDLIFSPTGTGLRTASLLVRSNAPGDSAITIALEGRRERVELTTSVATLDLGSVCPGAPVAMELTLGNAGSIGAGATVAIDPPFLLDRSFLSVGPGGSGALTVTLPPTSGEGLHIATLRVTDTLCGRTTTVAVRALVAAPDIVVSTGVIGAPIGFHGDGAMALFNRSAIDVTITQVSSGDPRLTVPSAALPLTVPAGATRSLPVRFTPVGSDTVRGMMMLLASPCGRAIASPVTGVAMAPTTAVSIPAIEAVPGQRVMLPLLFAGDTGGVGRGLGFTATLRFDASLLVPAGGTPRGTVIRGERRITISGDRMSGDTLARLELMAALGGADSTTIAIESFAWGEPSAPPPLLHDGVFTLLGICRTGAPRLVTPGMGAALKSIRPNPASTGTVIEFTTLESGATRLLVVDMLGRRVATLLDGELAPGTHTVTVDLAGVPQGSYFCVLETPTERRTGPLEVGR